MNRVSSSRAGLLSIVTLAGLSVAAACSSSSSTVNPNEGEDGGESSSGSSGVAQSSSSSGVQPSSSSGVGPSSSSGVGPSSSSGGQTSSSSSSSGGSSGVVGDGGGFVTIANTADGGCPTQSSITLGVHVHFSVTWPASTASNQGTGPVDIWLLSNQTGDTMFTGTAQTCGTSLPPIALNVTGAAAVCAPGMTCPTNVQIQFNDSEWDTDITRSFNLSGTQTGWNPGSTLTTTPSLGVIGLTNTAGAASVSWPAYCANNCACNVSTTKGSGATFTGTCGAFAGSDITDDDGDGKPGITANPLNNTMYSLPPTTVTLFSVPPLADEVYIVTRNQLALSGMRMNSCTEGSGSATVSLFDNHVVGCHVSSPAAECTSAQVSFLDQNRTIYGPNANNVASSSAPITGTVTIRQMSSTATCAEVRTID
jgi:hypothetical protein